MPASAPWRPSCSFRDDAIDDDEDDDDEASAVFALAEDSTLSWAALALAKRRRSSGSAWSLITLIPLSTEFVLSCCGCCAMLVVMGRRTRRRRRRGRRVGVKSACIACGGLSCDCGASVQMKSEKM